MAFFKVGVVVLVAAVAAVWAGPIYDNTGGDNAGPAIYTFSYDANDAESGNQYGHAEQRDGTSSSGEYRVLLPDGRTQVVTYTVEGDDGYVAKVTYEGGGGLGHSSGGYA
ncbi:pro-resilin-like [Homarus americanus]|uniref:pro-resilin-like n=1 Tax=Homarus americanus TaxID=6706 RepID=UPI001C475C3F|nr:pro-resilin-like [Homarus americanus]